MCDRQGLISLGLVPGGVLGLRKEKDAGRHFGGSLGKPLGRWAHGDSTAARRPGTFADRSEPKALTLFFRHPRVHIKAGIWQNCELRELCLCPGLLAW